MYQHPQREEGDGGKTYIFDPETGSHSVAQTVGTLLL